MFTVPPMSLGSRGGIAIVSIWVRTVAINAALRTRVELDQFHLLERGDMRIAFEYAVAGFLGTI